jgi:hypothetical protein
MILLRRYRLLFIKGVKVAGTSVEVFLGRHAAEDDIVTPIEPSSPGHVPRNYRGMDGTILYYNHIDARTVRRLLGEDEFHRMRRFGIVRHPVEKVKSMFAMEYVRRAGRYDMDQAIEELSSEATRYCDDAGRCLLTDVIRYEELQAGMAKLLSGSGIPFVRLDANEKSGYRRACPVEPALSPDQYQRIARKFSWEFEHFYPEVTAQG